MLKILTLKAISTVFNWIVVRLFTWNWPGLNKFIKPDQYRISRKSRWLGTCDLYQYCSNTYRKKNTHTHVLIWAVIVLFCSYNSSIHTLVHRHIVAYAVSTCFYDCVVYFSLTNKQINSQPKSSRVKVEKVVRMWHGMISVFWHSKFLITKLNV